MFNQPFAYRKINIQDFIAQKKCIVHSFSFRGKTKRYIVVIEQYNYNVHAVKFYLQEHKFCEHKYNRLANQNECSRVITTVGAIMRDEIFKKNPYASFAFQGSNSENEQKNNTKRFRLYTRVVENLIGPVYFEHRPIPEYSAYLMINRHNASESFIDDVLLMFNDIFVFQPNN